MSYLVPLDAIHKGKIHYNLMHNNGAKTQSNPNNATF